MRALAPLAIVVVVAACPPPPTAHEGEGEGAASEGEGEGAEGEGEGVAEGEGDDDVGYDELRQKSAHNAYQRFESLPDMLAYHDVRSIELDIHTTKSGFTSVDGDWFVFHDDNDTDTTCHLFSDCLENIIAFHNAVPNHEPITIFVDLKSGFSATGNHQAVDLDAALEADLGDALFPAHALMDRCATAVDLRGAVTTACEWPSERELRGKLVVVLTGGRACGLGGSLDTYLDNGNDGTTRDAFAAPQLDSTCNLDAYDTRPGVVFFNVDIADRALATPVRAAGLISRAFVVNDSAAWDQALGADITILATDKVNFDEDAFAHLNAANGFPFTCFNPADCAGRSEDIRATLMKVDSADIDGTSDNFVFVHEARDNAGAATTSLTALLSTENSHVQEFAKACLMARTSTAADAAYVAVCRPADNEPLRAQDRASNGASTTVTRADLAPNDSIDEPSVASARLVVDADGLCAEAQGSLDGVTFTTFHRACTDAPMTLQGLAASSHDGGVVRFVFVGLDEDGAPLSPLDDAAFSTSSIGTVRSHAESNGVLP